MSCKDCDYAQDNSGSAYVRIGNANVELNGCDKHLREALSRINGVEFPEHCPVVRVNFK